MNDFNYASGSEKNISKLDGRIGKEGLGAEVLSATSTHKHDDTPKFNPENARRLREQKAEKSTQSLREQFSVDSAKYPIFSQQNGRRYDETLRIDEDRQLNIDETLGLMVGATASTIASINGEIDGNPPSDHVIYLDKSARPVSWLVDEFWNDFANRKHPEESFLAIDRRYWFKMVGLEIDQNEYFVDDNGERRLATSRDFWKRFDRFPQERKDDFAARIRALYIEGGIEEEDPSKIMAMPTTLDDKNITIIDEVSRTGSTLEIAAGLLKLAIPKLGNINCHVFWSDRSKILESGEKQMGFAPIWYPTDKSDWRGRGVKDPNPDYYVAEYEKNPNNKTRAEKYGAIVLGEPLLRKEDEPGQLSWKLKDEMIRMHQDYVDGHILPNLPLDDGVACDKMYEKLSSLGVEFVPADEAQGNPNSYLNLLEYRNRKPEL